MLRHTVSGFASVCDVFRRDIFFCIRRGFLPLLAAMLLAAPQLAFANGLSVTVNPGSLDLTEGGSTGEYTVVLDDAPEEDVVIEVVGVDEDVLTVSTATLTFTADVGDTEGSWNTAQTVTVTTVEDDDAADERIVLTHTAKMGRRDAVPLAADTSVVVRITDDDTANKRVIISETEATVPEAGVADTYTVTLGTRPTGTVTVDVGGVTGELSVSPSRLVFRPGDWRDGAGSAITPAAKTVSIFAGNDFDADDDKATLTHKVRGGDYSNVRAGTVEVTVDDDDTRRITVVPASLNVAIEKSGTFTIKLDTQPKGTVTVLVVKDPSNTDAQVRVSPSSVRFSTGDWNRPKTVTVTAGSSAVAGSATVDLSVDASPKNRDTDYTTTELSSATVGVTISDALPSETVTLTSFPSLVEEGSTKEYTVKLDRNPSVATRTVYVTSSDTASVTVAPASLDFTQDPEGTTDGTWRTSRTVTVTGVRDGDAVEETVVVAHRFTSATGPIVRTSTVRVDELNTRGVSVSRTELEVKEGTSNTYTLTLDSDPVGGPVTVTITASSNQVTISPSQVTFTSQGVSETVTVTAVGDEDASANPSVTLSHKVRGAVGDYDNFSVSNVKVTVPEAQKTGIEIMGQPASMTEGTSETYEVRLTAQPTGTVTVRIRSDSDDVTLRPSQLRFTTSSWNQYQTVRIRAEHDADADDDPEVTLTHIASGGGYDQVSKETQLDVMEDDVSQKGVRVSPSALTITEGGSERRYTINLMTRPTATVRVRLGVDPSDAAPRIQIKPNQMTFTPDNWNVPVTVTVSAPEDHVDQGTHTDVDVTHTLSGGGYDDQAPTVDVRIRDNDERGVTLNPVELEVVQGFWQEYTVRLDSQPASTTAGAPVVTISPTRGVTGVTVSPGTLTFTASNWSSPQKVRVSAGDDATPGTGSVTHTVAAADTDYSAESAGSVALDIKDNAVDGVAVSPTVLEVLEGTSESYTIVLTQKPDKNVSIKISGAADDVSVSPSSMTFSTTNWSKERKVTVNVRSDDDGSDDPPITLTHEVTSEDTEYDGLVPSPVTVTPKDDDPLGVTVTPTSLTVAAGSLGTYTVKLDTQPLDAVTVAVNDPPLESITVEGAPLVFTTTDWKTAQTITVKVDRDGGEDNEQTVTLTHTVYGGDYPGDGDVPSVTVIIPVEGAPSAPRNLSAAGGNERVTLSWEAPANDGGSSITGYQVRYRVAGTENYGSWRSVTGTSTTVTGLDNGTSYQFQVRAVNGTSPGPPAETTETLANSAPGAPPGLTATGGDESVTLNWSAPEDGGSQIIRYEYRYAATGQTFSDWETVSGGGNATSVSVDNLTNGTEYGFQVRAVNQIGEGPHASASATPGRVPSAPTGLTAKSESETITVMWGAPADNGGSAITSYQVRYRMNGSNWSNWATVAGGANATSYILTGLTNGIGHEIEVRAVNAIGFSAAASVEATPMAGIDFAHFANGTSGGVTITSDIVLVNVETSAVTPAIYFYNQQGDMIDADSVVDVSADMEVAGDGALTVPMGIPRRGEMTISTNGDGALVVGSVRVFGTGRLGGVLRFEIPSVGVAGVGVSEPVSDAIFPARRMAGGIRTGAAIRNLNADAMTINCMLMQDGEVMDTATGELSGDGHVALFIDEMFPGSNTTDFVGSVRCTADDGMFAGVALEMDLANGIFTTLPLVSLDTGADSGGSMMLNFAHFANGDFGGTATSSDLVFVNVATSAVAPAIHFYDQDGEMIAADMVVDAMMEGVEVGEDGALTVTDEIPPMGEMTISTSGMGDGIVGSVRVVSDGPIGGVLRFDIPNIGVAGVGASKAVNAAIFPARRMADGINTGAAIRNLMPDMTMVTCRLMAGGQRMGEASIPLAGNGQNSQFINEMFPNANTDDFEGSVHCAASGSMFTGVALEMDFNNGIFTTLPVVSVQ